MLAPYKTLVGCSLVLVALATPGLAQEPEHFYQFFEKGKLVQLSTSEPSSFLAAVLLTDEDTQRLTDAQTLTTEQMVEKYPDLKEKVDAALADWVTQRQSRGLPEEAKSKVLFQIGRTPFTYRILTVKPDYLLVESVTDPSTKRVYAVDKIRSIGWSRGLEVRVTSADARPPRPR